MLIHGEHLDIRTPLWSDLQTDLIPTYSLTDNVLLVLELLSQLRTAARYGGLYSDLDTVTLATTHYLDNVVARAGSFVSNAALVFRRGQPFLLRLMEEADRRFSGQGWNSVGSQCQGGSPCLGNLSRTCHVD